MHSRVWEPMYWSFEERGLITGQVEFLKASLLEDTPQFLTIAKQYLQKSELSKAFFLIKKTSGQG